MLVFEESARRHVDDRSRRRFEKHKFVFENQFFEKRCSLDYVATGYGTGYFLSSPLCHDDDR